MAEISGLVIGAVALASLFNTCIDLFDKFELGRHHIEDYRLACNKLDLLRMRFKIWGECNKIDELSKDSPAIQKDWSEQLDIITHSQVKIKEILEDAASLTQVYKLKSRHSHLLPTPAVAREQLGTPKRITARGWFGLRKRTFWAVHGKQKFDDLINELDFLIDGLERLSLFGGDVICDLPDPVITDTIVRGMPRHLPNHPKLPVTPSQVSRSEMAARESGPSAEKSKWSFENLAPNDDNTIVFRGTQTNKRNATGNIGYVGIHTISNKDIQFDTHQINEGFSFGNVGVVSEQLVRQVLDRDQN